MKHLGATNQQNPDKALFFQIIMTLRPRLDTRPPTSRDDLVLQIISDG